MKLTNSKQEKLDIAKALIEAAKVVKAYQEQCKKDETDWRAEQNAPYLKNSSTKKPEKVGSVRI